MALRLEAQSELASAGSSAAVCAQGAGSRSSVTAGWLRLEVPDS